MVVSCPSTEVSGSDHDATGSVSGAYGSTVTITCDVGLLGGGDTTCSDGLQWSPVIVCVEAITDANIATARDAVLGGDLLTYGSMSQWDTSYVTNFQNLFQSQTTFNEDISSW